MQLTLFKALKSVNIDDTLATAVVDQLAYVIRGLVDGKNLQCVGNATLHGRPSFRDRPPSQPRCTSPG